MKKIQIEYKGVKYPARVIDLSAVSGFYTEPVTVAGWELSEALGTDLEEVDSEVSQIDNGIYYYTDSGVMEANLTDAELIWLVAKNTDIEQEMTDQHYYNLMRLCEAEIGKAHECGVIRCNAECYEMGGDYSAYIYGDGYNVSLYHGKSARECCLVMLATLTTLAHNNEHFIGALSDGEPADPATTTPADDPAQDVYAEYSADMRKAVAYINEQLEPEDKAIICAKVDKNFKQHMNPAYGIDDGKITDLLGEYGMDHDLPEGWWEEECDLDDIVLLIDFEG